jgi:hypothetical protein
VLRPLPPLAFIPLFVIWFGIGELPKLIVIGVAPIMAVATVASLDQVPEDLRLCARTLGATSLFCSTSPIPAGADRARHRSDRAGSVQFEAIGSGVGLPPGRRGEQQET